MAAFDYSSVAELFPTKIDAELFPAKSRGTGDIPLGMGDLRAQRMPSVSQSRSFQPSYFQTRAWKSIRRYSTATEFADYTTAKTIRWSGV